MAQRDGVIDEEEDEVRRRRRKEWLGLDVYHKEDQTYVRKSAGKRGARKSATRRSA
jgi:hypothetical protein